MKEQKAVCISASNIMESQKNSTTYRICKLIAGVLHKKNVLCKIIDLRKSALNPCTGCGQCYEGKRCVQDTNFNCIYEELLTADYVFFVSPIMRRFLQSCACSLKKWSRSLSCTGGRTINTGQKFTVHWQVSFPTEAVETVLLKTTRPW